MIGCKYNSSNVPFEVPSGTSYCIYYCVFCRIDSHVCPFDYKPHHLVKVKEFTVYPAIDFQLSLFFDDYVH